jgi:hypothetical protein
MHLTWLANVREMLRKNKTDHSIWRRALKQLLFATTPVVGAHDCKQGGNVRALNTETPVNPREPIPFNIGMALANEPFIDKGLAVCTCRLARLTTSRPSVPEMGIVRREIAFPIALARLPCSLLVATVPGLSDRATRVWLCCRPRHSCTQYELSR